MSNSKPTQGDNLDKILEHALLKHANDFAEYVQGKRPEPNVGDVVAEARADIQAHVVEAVQRGQVKMLDSLYEGGFLGQWDYDRIRHSLTNQSKPKESK